MANVTGKIFARILDFLFPIFCVGCEVEGSHCCGMCLATIPRYPEAQDGATEIRTMFAASPFREKSLLADLLHRLKYDGAREVADIVVELFAPGILEELHDAGQIIFVPVPLHWRRKNERGFNQSELLAHLLAQKTDGAVQNLLRRTRYTQPQVSLGRAERRVNVHDAFSMNRWAVIDPAATYVLVDDVYTTGATIGECARALHAAGAAKVLAAVIGKAEFATAN